MFEFLKTKTFHILFSFLVGIFVIIIFKKGCSGDDCIEHINPNIDEINIQGYKLWQIRSPKCII